MTPNGVHPLATAFPMMSDDELAELAADIKTNGLLHAIVVDDVGLIVDGRNRDRACKIAGVEPRYEQLNGQDPIAFVVSANVVRRNLSKGQRAMALAILYPEPEKGGRGKNTETRKAVVSAGFSPERLKQARLILRTSRELAEQVRDGVKPFDEALGEAQEINAQRQSSETVLAELRANAPDLADLVADERLTVGEAYSAYKKRVADAEAAEANKRETMMRLSEAAWRATTAWAAQGFADEVAERLKDNDFRAAWLDRLRCDRERLAEIPRGAKAFAALLTVILEAGE